MVFLFRMIKSKIQNYELFANKVNYLYKKCLKCF